MTIRACSAIALLGALCGCQGNGGAISVRWHILDLTTGQDFDPTAVSGPNGVCQNLQPPATCHASWLVHRVRVVLADPVSGIETMAANPDLQFPCRQREATTPFSLTPGTFAMSLQAFDPARAGPDGSSDFALDGVTPAPSVRVVRTGEVVNLDVIEIGVHSLPTGSMAGTTPIPSVFDGGCPDLIR